MSEPKYLIALKNPPSSFMVDGFDNSKFLEFIKNIGCFQEGLSLWITTESDCNIAYIQEMSKEEVELYEEKLAQLKAKLIKPKFIPPTKH